MACLLTNRKQNKNAESSSPWVRSRLLPNAGHTTHTFLVISLWESLGGKFGVKLGRGLGVVDSGGLRRHPWREVRSPCLYHEIHLVLMPGGNPSLSGQVTTKRCGFFRQNLGVGMGGSPGALFYQRGGNRRTLPSLPAHFALSRKFLLSACEFSCVLDVFA